MQALAIVSTSLLFFSLIANVYFYLKSKRPIPVRKESIELQEFISDLASGGGMLAVRRIDPNSIILRSPRDNR